MWRSSDRALRDALMQAGGYAALVGVTCVLGMAGAGALARPFYLAAGLAMAVLIQRRSPWLYLTWTFWFWTVTPFVRRYLNFYGGFNPQDLILVAPNLLTLLMAPAVLQDRRLQRLPEFRTGLLVLVPVLYGVGVNFTDGDILPATFAATDWLSPLLYYFYLLTLAPRMAEGERVLSAFVPLSMAVMIGYGLFQFYNPPPWDVAWVLDSKLFTVGLPVPFGLRTFGTTNAPAVLAIWIGTLLLLAIHFRNLLGTILLPFAALLLAVTFIRSMLACTVAAFVGAALVGGLAGVRSLLVAAVSGVIVLGLLSVLNPEIGERLADRVSSFGALDQDSSAEARTWLYQAAPGLIDAVPMGRGIGALGRGAVSSAGELANLDSGLIAVFIAFGWLFGPVFLAGMAATIGQCVMATRNTKSPAALAMTAAALAGLGQLLFTNFVGFYPAVQWFVVGYASAMGIAARDARSWR